jgi:hypothetical protein
MMAEKDRIRLRSEEVYPMPCHGEVTRGTLPLYRQAPMTLAHWAGFAAFELMPLYTASCNPEGIDKALWG